MAEVMLTTLDNPFDPFDQVDDWRRFDVAKGYNTEALIARVCNTTDQLGSRLQEAAWEEAIDDIIKYCDFGIYKKVVRQSR